MITLYAWLVYAASLVILARTRPGPAMQVRLWIALGLLTGCGVLLWTAPEQVAEALPADILFFLVCATAGTVFVTSLAEAAGLFT